MDLRAIRPKRKDESPTWDAMSLRRRRNTHGCRNREAIPAPSLGPEVVLGEGTQGKRRRWVTLPLGLFSSICRKRVGDRETKSARDCLGPSGPFKKRAPSF